MSLPLVAWSKPRIDNVIFTKFEFNTDCRIINDGQVESRMRPLPVVSPKFRTKAVLILLLEF